VRALGISGIRSPTSTSPAGGRTWCRGRCQLHLALVQAYAPELNKRLSPHLKPTNKSYRIDEPISNVKGEDKYL